MKLLRFSFFFLFFYLTSFAQDSVVVQVRLTDKKYDDPIHNAKAILLLDDFQIARTTNNNGIALFRVPKGVKGEFQFTHYKFASANFTRKMNGDADTLKFAFSLEYITTQNHEEVVVTAPGIPMVYFQSDRLHVSDFEITNTGDVILLTYPKRLKKGSELLLWDGKRIKARFDVPERAEELVRDYRGNAHIICESSVYCVQPKEKEIGIATIEKDYFFKYLAPILDTNKSKLYFSNFSKDYPAFDYFAYDQMDSSYTKILGIKDDLMMELYRAEYKWADIRTRLWAENKEIQTGVDAEIWVGANYFTNSVYYKELYAPLFHRNDSLFVFDYYKDQLHTFDALGNELDSVPIYHHYDKRNTGWQANLIQDRSTGQIYGIFDRAGYTYIGWVNTSTGEITEQVKLEYRYAHNIAVYNNYVYYIYRPFESAQKKYLYKERLPYDFGGAF